MATSAFALTSTEYGPVNVEICYVTDMGEIVSGDVVVLQTTSPTYWGKEVTGSTTTDLPIYGVSLSNISAVTGGFSGYIKVQTYGYCPIVRLTTYTNTTARQTSLRTSGVQGKATAAGSGVSGNTTALETATTDANSTHIIKAFLNN